MDATTFIVLAVLHMGQLFALLLALGLVYVTIVTMVRLIRAILQKD